MKIIISYSVVALLMLSSTEFSYFQILTRLYLFKKNDLPDRSETPESEEEIASWMKAFGSLVGL